MSPRPFLNTTSYFLNPFLQLQTVTLAETSRKWKVQLILPFPKYITSGRQGFCHETLGPVAKPFSQVRGSKFTFLAYAFHWQARELQMLRDLGKP